MDVKDAVNIAIQHTKSSFRDVLDLRLEETKINDLYRKDNEKEDYWYITLSFVQELGKNRKYRLITITHKGLVISSVGRGAGVNVT